MPRYRRDHGAMRPILYECPENDVSAKSPDDFAQESPHYNLITIQR